MVKVERSPHQLRHVAELRGTTPSWAGRFRFDEFEPKGLAQPFAVLGIKSLLDHGGDATSSGKFDTFTECPGPDSSVALLARHHSGATRPSRPSLVLDPVSDIAVGLQDGAELFSCLVFRSMV